MCVHIRRGDFLTDIMLETTKEFTVPAIKFAYDYVKLKTKSPQISLVFIGNDPEFVHSLQIPKLFANTYSSEKLSRGEDICFGIHYCDSMIMTASGSTFSWWISYLMKPDSIIFYNSQVEKFSNFSKDYHDFDIFPPEWIKLTLKNNEVKLETKWWHQRNNKLPDLPSIDLQPWS
uniref:Alpha-1,2-fucosyltransferase n=1 Tax=Panagrolaimus sp. JU765 TaxID=591449 RepID=A0AC34Q395_9BILA